MKRLLLLGFCLVVSCISCAIPAFAEESEYYTGGLLDEESCEVVDALAGARGMSCPDSYEVLYDHNDEPQFILGRTSDGYLIVDTVGWQVQENGSGTDPYQEYPDAKKYYGGVCRYAVATEGGFFDIVLGMVTESFIYGETLEATDAPEDGYGQPGLLSEGYAFRAVNTVLVPDADARIKRIAFGNNTGGTNSCTAVAVGIVLNYLDKTVSESFVSDDMEAENLIGYLVDSSTGAIRHPQAEALHSHLVYDCNMPGPNYAQGAAGGVTRYKNKTAERRSTGLSLDYGLAASAGSYSWLKGEIDRGRPAMLTTTWFHGLDPKYDTHTMVVYGYRENGDGTTEVLLHPGWSQEIKSDYRIGELWARAEVATYVYAFDYRLSGWHETPQGWKYFNPDGTEKPGVSVNRINGATRYDTSAQTAVYDRVSSYYAVVVSGADTAWPDTVSASGLAGILNAPLITTDGTYLTGETIRALTALGVRSVYIVGGTPTISAGVEASIRSVPGVASVRRIAGEDRYATAEAVYNTFPNSWLHPTGGYKHPYYASNHQWKNGTKKKACLLVSGNSFPDGISASALSAYARYPVFLVRTDGTMTEATKSILRNGKFDQVYCVGGGITSAAGIACDLVDPADIVGAPIYGGGTFVAGQNWYTRLIGDSRYTTSVEAFNAMLREGASAQKVTIASGLSAVDGFSGGALKRPLLLADAGNAYQAIGAIMGRHGTIQTFIVLGSTNTISDATVNELVGAWWRSLSGWSPYSLYEDSDGYEAQDQDTGDGAEPIPPPSVEAAVS